MIREVGQRPAGVELVRDSVCMRTWVFHNGQTIGWFTDAQIVSGVEMVIDWEAYFRGALVLERPAPRVAP